MIKAEDKKSRIEPSFFDDLFKELSKSMFHGLVERVESGARDVLSWTLRRMAFTIIAVGLVITATVLLLISGIEGLREAHVPPSLAYLAAGAVGMTAGLVLLLKKS